MKKVVGLAMIIALITGCGETKTEEKTTEKRISVNTVKVEIVTGCYNLRYSGSIEASQTIPLSFKTPGTVERIYVEVGDAVKKGQKIASVDNSDMQNIYNTMLSKFNQAQDAYDRLKIVYREGSLPEIKWVEMQSNYDQAKSALELAKNNLEKCTMFSPVDGFVGRRNIEPGQSSISISMAPIELVKIETVHIKISVPENEISKIKKGQKADISVSALNGKQFEGEVTNVSPVADAISRTYPVKISVKNPTFELKPGMVCDASLNIERKDKVLLVPYKAVSMDSEGNNFVYVISQDKDKVRKQIIISGNYDGKGIEVLSGLSIGELVVSEGCEKLNDNSLIRL